MTGTMLGILRGRAEQISQDGVRLLREFSGMHPANAPNDLVVFISPSGNQFWDDLSPEGNKIQARLLPEIDRFSELIQTLSRNLPNSAQNVIADALVDIRRAIEQDGTTWWQTKGEAVDGFRKLIDHIITTLANYCIILPDTFYAIPDTNALYGNPDIEHWQFEDANYFTIILTPTILSELDNHKVNHKNPQIREKASALIRRIKEYRRRGSLHEGVTVIKDRISLRSIANEPNMSKSLSWFDSNNADDRFLATTLEIIRGNLGVIIFIVTLDINMQNKAEMAGIPFRETPTELQISEQG